MISPGHLDHCSTAAICSRAGAAMPLRPVLSAQGHRPNPAGWASAPAKVQRYAMGEQEIRAVVVGPDGALWLLEDQRRGGAGTGLLEVAHPNG